MNVPFHIIMPIQGWMDYTRNTDPLDNLKGMVESDKDR